MVLSLSPPDADTVADAPVVDPSHGIVLNLPVAFEQLVEDLVEKSLGPCRQALKD